MLLRLQCIRVGNGPAECNIGSSSKTATVVPHTPAAFRKSHLNSISRSDRALRDMTFNIPAGVTVTVGDPCTGSGFLVLLCNDGRSDHFCSTEESCTTIWLEVAWWCIEDFHLKPNCIWLARIGVCYAADGRRRWWSSTKDKKAAVKKVCASVAFFFPVPCGVLACHGAVSRNTDGSASPPLSLSLAPRGAGSASLCKHTTAVCTSFPVVAALSKGGAITYKTFSMLDSGRSLGGTGPPWTRCRVHWTTSGGGPDRKCAESPETHIARVRSAIGAGRLRSGPVDHPSAHLFGGGWTGPRRLAEGRRPTTPQRGRCGG